MGTTRNLLNSSIARTGFTVIYAVISFFFLPFLVSHLGERWYGIWVLVAGLIANSYLLDIGLTSAVTRYVSKSLAENDSRAANQVINTCLVIYSCLALVIILATLALSAFARNFVDDAADLPIIRATMILIGLQYAAEFPFKAFAGIVSSRVRYDLLMMSRLLNVVLTTALMVYFVRRGYGIIAMALIVLSVDQLTNFIYYKLAKYLFPDLKLSRTFVTRSLVKELFSYSSWSFVIQLANQLRFRTDSLVIGAMISATAVTYYAVGLRLVEYFVDFVNRATNMMTPVFTRYYYERNFDEIRNKYILLSRINAMLGLFGGGMLIILGKAFILRWMGPTFEQSYQVMVVLVIAMVVEVIGIHADNILYAISRHKYLAIINVIEAVMNITLSILLAKKFGIIGVAMGTAIPLLLFRIFVIPVYVGRCIELSVWRWYKSLAPLAAFTVAYLVVFGFAVRPFLAVPTFSAIVIAGIASAPLYLIAIPYIGFSASERALLHNALPGRLQRFTAPFLGRRAVGS